MFSSSTASPAGTGPIGLETSVKPDMVAAIVMGAGMTPPFQDHPPGQPALTDYDRQQAGRYFRLLDAAAEAADWREVVSLVFGIDASSEPARAHLVYNSHLARARWLSAQGYRDVVALGANPPGQ